MIQLDRDAIMELVESYFKRVRKLGGDTGECSAAGVADWLLWQKDTDNFAVHATLSSAQAANFEQRYFDLAAAVEALYFAAYWHADRSVDELKLWTAVRDAAAITPGQTGKVLGADKSTLSAAGAIAHTDGKLKVALTELLRLYDWRNELGQIERDPNHDKKQMTTWLNKYGREKKRAWAAAREALAAAPAVSPAICYMPCNAHQGMTFKITLSAWSVPAVQVCPICTPPKGAA